MARTTHAMKHRTLQLHTHTHTHTLPPPFHTLPLPLLTPTSTRSHVTVEPLLAFHGHVSSLVKTQKAITPAEFYDQGRYVLITGEGSLRLSVYETSTGRCVVFVLETKGPCAFFFSPPFTILYHSKRFHKEYAHTHT